MLKSLQEVLLRIPGANQGAFLQRHLRLLLSGAGLAIVLVLIVAVYISQQRRQAITASQMLAVAQTAGQLEEVLVQYPSSPSAPTALLALASSQYAAGAYEQALMLYDRFIQQYPKHFMRPAAVLGRVLCQEAQGAPAQALAGFNAFLAAYPDHFLLPQAYLGQARCLQQLRRAAEAQVVYEDFIAAHPDSEWKVHMEMALDRLAREQRAERR